MIWQGHGCHSMQECKALKYLWTSVTHRKKTPLATDASKGSQGAVLLQRQEPAWLPVAQAVRVRAAAVAVTVDPQARDA